MLYFFGNLCFTTRIVKKILLIVVLIVRNIISCSSLLLMVSCAARWRHLVATNRPQLHYSWFAVLTILTSAGGLFPPVLVFLWNTAIGALPPRGTGAAIFLLLPPTAAGWAVQLVYGLKTLLGLTRCLGGQHPLGIFRVGPWWGHYWAWAVGLGSCVMALKKIFQGTHLFFGVGIPLHKKWKTQKTTLLTTSTIIRILLNIMFHYSHYI